MVWACHPCFCNHPVLGHENAQGVVYEMPFKGRFGRSVTISGYIFVRRIHSSETKRIRHEIAIADGGGERTRGTHAGGRKCGDPSATQPSSKALGYNALKWPGLGDERDWYDDDRDG